MRLASYWRSSSSWRVRIGLAHKGLEYELVPVHLLREGGEQRRSDFVEKNQLGQVPVLEVDGPGTTFRLTQSLAILEYLDEIQPEPPLLPAAPEARARARELSEIVNSGIQPFHNIGFLRELKTRGFDAHPLARTYLERGLRALERLAAPSAGRFLVGDAVSLADLYLVPALYAARRFTVELEPYPTLLRVESECAALPAFQAAHPSAQPDRDVDA